MSNTTPEIIGDTEEQTVNVQLNNFVYFPSSVYTTERPEFLKNVRAAATTALAKRKKEVQLDKIYPVYMSEDLMPDPKMKDFLDFVGETGWNVLQSQGYDMDRYDITFTEVWCQEHHKHSSMDQHVHNAGVQLVGFYFLDCPEKSSKVLFHDPRPGKVQINLPETDVTRATPASDIINFVPTPGMLIITNSWLPHSYTKNGANSPLRFVHFNMSVTPTQRRTQCPVPSAEIV